MAGFSNIPECPFNITDFAFQKIFIRFDNAEEFKEFLSAMKRYYPLASTAWSGNEDHHDSAIVVGYRGYEKLQRDSTGGESLLKEGYTPIMYADLVKMKRGWDDLSPIADLFS